MQPHPLFTPYKQAFLHQCPKSKNEPFILTLVEVTMPAERQDRYTNLQVKDQKTKAVLQDGKK
jgi:hypothetical protein